MLEKLKFVVVEDKEEDRHEILNQLTDAGLEPENKLAVVGTYEEAKECLADLATEVDTLFLDLNIPRNASDPRPEDKHGSNLLKAIHSDFNRRPGVDIKVIVISGQDLVTNDAARDVFMETYKGTLIGIVNKPNLAKMLQSSLKRLKRDPLAAALRRVDLDLEEELSCLRDTGRSSLDRVKAARKIAIRIAINEIDVRNGSKGSRPDLEDNLSKILSELRGRFFKNPDTGWTDMTAGGIDTEDGWGGHVWRGVLFQHLQIINTYRNLVEHMEDQPYKNSTSDPDTWDIPSDLLDVAKEADPTAQIVTLATIELLEWYLPWHEQVYLKANLS
ncbi:MAG: response regulator [Verrucomicrobiales bacterium]|nr:response regulator [Verrucomicrobiales bacterium]